MADAKTKRLHVAGSFGGGGGIPLPETAEVGQYIVVSAVDDNGVVTATEAVTVESLPDAEEAKF